MSATVGGRLRCTSPRRSDAFSGLPQPVDAIVMYLEVSLEGQECFCAPARSLYEAVSLGLKLLVYEALSLGIKLLVYEALSSAACAGGG